MFEILRMNTVFENIQTRTIQGCLILLGALLPWHGTLTVFLPDFFRFWKEIILIILFFLFIIKEGRDWKNKQLQKLTTPQMWALGFLLWTAILVVINSDISTALVAARYLTTGFITFFLLSRLLQKEKFPKKQSWQFFALNFIVSVVLSILFGTWAKYGGGFEVLQNFYSQTISSWVPGQTVPLYHEAGSFIRMQGGSSGPIEFAHLLFAALCFLPFVKLKNQYKYILALILFLGIWQSFSRAVLAISILTTLIFSLQKHTSKLKKGIPIGIIVIVGIGGVFSVNNNLYTNFIQRAGTSEHFTRPIEAFKLGLQSPIIGKLGNVGPAARAKNLRENNNDQAFIAENVFADYWVQLGLMGLIITIGFFLSLLQNVSKNGKIYIVAIIILANAATLFDMTPLSLIFFASFAWHSAIKRTFQT